MIRAAVQRHFFLLLSAILALAICFLVGFGLTRYSSDGSFSEIVHAHESYFLLWRVLAYSVAIFYWPRLVNAIIRKRNIHAAGTRLTRTGFRQPIVLVCFAFELFIVQNTVGLLLAFALHGAPG